jgi:hypothetical protein
MKTLFSVAALLALSSSVRADKIIIIYEEPTYSRRHFYLGAEGLGSVVVNETGPHSFFSSGGGINLFLGGRIHRHLALEFGWSPTFHGQPGSGFGETTTDGLALSAITADLKILPLRGWVQPYVAFGPAGYVLHDWAFHYLGGGGGFQVGGGVDFYVYRHLSFGLKSQYRGAELVDYDPAHDRTFLSMLTFAGNITGHF